MGTITFDDGSPITPGSPAGSTLSVTFDDIKKAVGDFLGYKRTSANWTADQIVDIDESVKAGLRRVYGAYDWTFLRPVTTLATVADQWQYDMPASFASIDGQIIFEAGSAIGNITVVGIHDILTMRVESDRTGQPEFAAIRFKSSTGTAEQTCEMSLYPTPDMVYTLTYRYRVLPSMLVTTTNEYPLGGETYGELIRVACLAAAEEGVDGNPGTHQARYERLLAEAIRADGYMQPDTLGVMGQPSMLGDRIRGGRVMYNGVYA